MAIDSSIYQNIKPIETPDMMGSIGKAMSLSQLALQNRKLQSDAATQDAMKQAYARNMGQDGKLNQQGVLSDLASSSPEALMTAQEHFTKMNKAETEGKTANVELATKIAAAADPYMEYLAKLPEDKRAQEFHPIIKQMEASGIPTNNIPKASDGTYLYGGKDSFAQLYGSFQNAKLHLDNLQTQASTGKTKADTAKTYAEIENLNGKGTGKPLAAEQTDKLAGHVAAFNILGDLRDAIKNNTSDIGPVAGRMASSNPYNTRGQSLGSLADKAAQVIGKSLEGGKLAEGDIKRYRSMLPNQTDTPDVALAKLEQVARLVAQQKNADLETYASAGLNVGNFNKAPIQDIDVIKPKNSPQFSDPLSQTANASNEAPPHNIPGASYGATVLINGKHYNVGPDGNTLIPIKTKVQK